MHYQPGTIIDQLGFGVFPVKLDDCDRSSITVLFTEYPVIQYAFGRTDEKVRFQWHNKDEAYANICFADGHVAYHKVKPFTKNSVPPYTFHRGGSKSPTKWPKDSYPEI